MVAGEHKRGVCARVWVWATTSGASTCDRAQAKNARRQPEQRTLVSKELVCRASILTVPSDSVRLDSSAATGAHSTGSRPDSISRRSISSRAMHRPARVIGIRAPTLAHARAARYTPGFSQWVEESGIVGLLQPRTTCALASRAN